MDLLANLALGAPGGVFPRQPVLLSGRGRPGDRDRRPAGAGPGGHHRHAAARDLHAAAGLVPDHDRGDLLRRPVRRLHHRHPGQPAGGDLVRGHRDGRLSDGAPGPRGRRPGHGRHRIVLRRHHLHVAGGCLRPAPGHDRPQVRPRRVLLPHGPRADGVDRDGAWPAPERHRDDRARPAPRAHRHRRHLRRAAVYVRAAGARRRHRLRDRRHGHVRRGRDRPQPGDRGHARR